ncbi:MAG: GNAT family N-acetyltransferase [Hyphomicrobiales bacterium]
MTRGFTLRNARREDASEIAKLFLISSDGLAEYIWSKIDAPGLSLAEIGAGRYARDDVAFSYRHCMVAERHGTTVGMLHGFEMPESGGETEEDPVLRPYAELEDAGSYYISGIALFPDHRGQGLGTALLEAAHERAVALGLPRASLICFEQNEGAMRLYQRFGYQETARRPLVAHPMLHYAEGDAVLLARAV